MSFVSSFGRRILLLLCLSLSLSMAATPIRIPYNNSATIGPDGPWNFITLSVGSSPSSNVSFHPLIENPNSWLIDGGNCKQNASLCPSTAQYYDMRAKSATSNARQDLNRTSTGLMIYGDISNVHDYRGDGYYWIETLNAPLNFGNISALITDNVTGLVGRKPYKPISFLSLEQYNYQKQNLNTTKGQPANSSTVMETAYWAGQAPAFGLHVGAAAFRQPGSLHFGGYDASRVLGRVLQVKDGDGFPIQSISFGTDSGDSPWKGKPAPPGNMAASKPARNDTRILPHVPYLYLPREWCNQIAGSLPVTYDDDTNLYLWNTSDPWYRDIVTSPSYLNFTFKADPPFSIRLPFATLNLTLEAPLKDKPTPYFPCYPREDLLALGRAFLQSALWGRAVAPDALYYYMAQAPGPVINSTTKSNPVGVVASNPVYSAVANAPSWADSWKGVLRPLGQASISPSDSSSSSSGPSDAPSTGLSSGGKAGIAIGVLVGVGLIAGVLFYFVRRTKRQHGMQQQQQQQKQHQQQAPPRYDYQQVADTSPSRGALGSSGSPSTHVGAGGTTTASRDLTPPGDKDGWAVLKNSRGSPMPYTVTGVAEIQRADSRPTRHAHDRSMGKAELGGSMPERSAARLGGIELPEMPEMPAEEVRYELSATSGPVELPIDVPPPVPPKD